MLLLIVYLFGLVFFFFKQKTAYEMRISDWSSDVCSSDLLERQNMDPLIKIESFKNLLGLQSTDHAAALYNMQPQDITRAQRVMGDDKIGRASCRERVCRYV